MKTKIALIIMLAIVSFVAGKWYAQETFNPWGIPRLLTNSEEQRELFRLGFYNGPIDGIRGPLHIQAKQDWELEYCEEQAEWAIEPYVGEDGYLSK